jgi:hypothetical protein
LTSFVIPIDLVGEALVSACWSALETSLGLKTCSQSIFEQLTLTGNIEAELPALRIMEPAWDTSGPLGVSPVPLPAVDGRMSFLLAYGRTFLLTDTAETWSRQLMVDAQAIGSALWQGDMQIPGFTPPANLVVKRLYLGQVAAAASPGDEDLGVRIAEVQIRVNIDVQVRAER